MHLSETSLSHSFDGDIKLEFTETLAETFLAATMLSRGNGEWALSASSTLRCWERGEGCLCSAD